MRRRGWPIGLARAGRRIVAHPQPRGAAATPRGARVAAGSTVRLRAIGAHEAQVVAPAPVEARFVARGERDRKNDPHQEERPQQGRPAVGNEGQGLSRRGKNAHDAADVQKRLENEHNRTAARDHGPHAVGRVAGDLQAAVADGHEEDDDDDSAHHAELVADNGEDEVGFGFGQVEVLLDGVAQPHPEQAAFADRIEGPDELVARAVGVGIGVEKGHAIRAIGRHDDREGRKSHDEPHQRDDRFPRHTGKGRHGDNAHQADSSRSQVGLGRIEQAQGRDDDPEHIRGKSHLVDGAVSVLIEQLGGDEDEGHLGKLRRLEAHRAQGQPPLGAQAHASDCRRKQKQDHAGNPISDEKPPAPLVVGDEAGNARANGHAEKADGSLLDQIARSRRAFVQRFDRR